MKVSLKVRTRSGRKVNFFHYHSLSLVTIGILLGWIILYARSDPEHHAGAFFGNAIADWSGSVIIILLTKYLFERGSGESNPLHKRIKTRFGEFVYAHSLTIFLLVTGIGWLVLYMRMSATSKWGQVVGNIASEWVQMLGLVLLTKRLIERGSKESHR